MSKIARYLPYRLELTAPAIVSTLFGDPNSASTQSFIPGSAIRGATASRLIAQGSEGDSADFQELILGGAVRFLHAYVEAMGERTLPTPLTWVRPKTQGDDSIFDLASSADESGQRLVKSDLPPFVAFSGSRHIGVRPRSTSRVHHQRDRNKGRAWAERGLGPVETAHGAVFTYESLDAGQAFRGLIQCLGESEEDVDRRLDRIEGLLHGGAILIGRSGRAGYGGVGKIHFRRKQDSEVRRGDIVDSEIAPGQPFRVYLTSSCIVRDDSSGQVDPCALTRCLIGRLGGESVIDPDAIRTFWEFERLGGFNRKWRLETPQAPAVRAGSVLVFQARQCVPLELVRRIEREGIGERRMEGFGRLAFLKHRDIHNIGRLEESPYQIRQSSTPPSPMPAAVRLIQRRLLDIAVQREIDARVEGNVLSTDHLPNPSLIGRLRTPLRQPDPLSGLKTLEAWLADPESETSLKKDARRKLENCVLANDKSLFEWLREHCRLEVGTAVAAPRVLSRCRLTAEADDPDLLGIAEERVAAYAGRLIDSVLSALSRKAAAQNKEVEHA